MAATAGPEGLAALELAIRTAMTKLGGSLLEDLLALDTGHRGQRADCGEGHQATFVSYRGKTLDTVLGPIEYRRAYYYCADCGHGVVPRDDELGVAHASLTPGLAAMVDRVGAAVAFGEGRDLLAELAGIELSTKRVERCAEADGKAVAAAIDSHAAAVATGEVVPLGPATSVAKLYVAVDGTGVPAVPAGTAGRKGKGPDGRAHTREVKLGVVFTQTTTDDEGFPIRDPGSSSYVATLESVEHFGTLVDAEARRRGSAKATEVVVLGDGATWIWALAKAHFPKAAHIVDLYHAREHLSDLAKLLAPELGDDRAAWLAERKDELDDGDIPAILAAARALDVPANKTNDLGTALGYFENNAARMQYKAFRDAGHFVGSGSVEAGCKAVVAQRLKLSGMRWSVRGATGIVTLRCQEASGRWEEICHRPRNQTSVA
ncbi:MAG: ISKra4 family transposase [Actinomycetota bacterium]|nr:ISKra4 family transposase [Actinomycetota bacterium]